MPPALADVLTRSRYRLLLVALAAAMAVSFATRVALAASHHAIAVDGLGPTLAAFAVGAGFDLVAALWLALPLALALGVVPSRLARRRWMRILLALAGTAYLYGLLFTAAAEWFFFQEFDSRFNFVAVDYLLYPTEVLENIWESYPTGWILAGIGVVTLAVMWSLRREPALAGRQPVGWRGRAAATIAYVAALVGLTAAAHPELARVSADRALNEVAGNGVDSFFAALRGSRADYEGLYPELPEGDLFPRLRRLLREPETVPGSFQPRSTLRETRSAGPLRRDNVVVVLEESLGSEFIGALRGPEPSLTPWYDALTREGTLLTRAYSTGNRTIRAIEATTSSLPPLPGVSVVRRPQSEGLFTLPGLLAEEGYTTEFVYGGRALFDGMGGYLTRNGVQRVVDQGDFPGDAFHTAWGVADEAIFDRALDEMEALHASGRPFYMLVLSVSNHRPFTFPEGEIVPDPALHRRENAVRYADWALGRFMAQAGRRGLREDTLFVLMGDHGARVYGSSEIPLASYEVPILFLGPQVPAGRRVDTLASSLDVPPTVLSLLGLDYPSRFFGHDVFAVDPAAGRALMTHNADIALLRGDRMAVLGLHGTVGVYDCDLEAASCRPDPGGADADPDLVADAIAYYAGADRLYEEGGYGLVDPTPAAGG